MAESQDSTATLDAILNDVAAQPSLNLRSTGLFPPTRRAQYRRSPPRALLALCVQKPASCLTWLRLGRPHWHRPEPPTGPPRHDKAVAVRRNTGSRAHKHGRRTSGFDESARRALRLARVPCRATRGAAGRRADHCHLRELRLRQIGRNQWQSVAISGNQWQSVPISAPARAPSRSDRSRSPPLPHTGASAAWPASPWACARTLGARAAAPWP